MIMHIDQGHAKDENGNLVYGLATSMTGSPIVTSRKTGKRWILKWHDIVKIAIESGLDDEEGKAHG